MPRRNVLFFLSVLLPFAVSSQQTLVYSEPEATYHKAVILFESQKYSAAAHLFELTSQSITEAQSTLKVNADYYYAVCSMNLFHNDAEKQMLAFIQKHPQSPEVHKIYFLLGNYEYRKHKFKEALAWYDKVEPSYLEGNETNEFYFKRDYCSFHQNKMDLAKTDFLEITNTTSSFYPDAKYYYGYIAYHQKNYQTAAGSFILLKDNPVYAKIVPFYIAECYYLEGDYEQSAQYAVGVVDVGAIHESPLLNEGEIRKIAAESYYRLKRYTDAITWFLKYAKGGSLPDKQSYELGYSYFATDQYEQAIPYLGGASSGKDSLAQDALYHLGVAYLKTDNKSFAANAFKDAAQLDFDQKLKEDAFFNYVKISYETSYDPFNGAISALTEYLNKYPNSVHHDEASQYLVNIYTSTHNYETALKYLAEIKNRDSRIEAIYQRLNYYCGVDLFNNGKMEPAISYFENSLKYNQDQKLHLLAYYWKAEAFYREKKYNDAVAAYNDYINQPGSFNTPEYGLSQYGAGYACFEMKDYDNSGNWFRKYVNTETQDKKRLSDANNRIGDGYFVRENYADAIPYYAQTIQLNTFDVDYACYQKGVALGLTYNYPDKIKTLTSLLANFPKSSYYSSAMMEIANAYLLNNQTKEAADEYRAFLTVYPSSPDVNQCLLQLGMIYYNGGQNDSALLAWGKVAENDKNSPDGQQAITHIKMLFTAEGQVQKMQDYLSNIGVSLSQSLVDSATYSVVKSDYLNQNFDKLLPDANNYVQKFPGGVFSGEVHFFRAECYFKKGNNDSALSDYSYVLKSPKSYYTLTALKKAAQLAYNKKNYEEALNYYNELGVVYQDEAGQIEARTGKMLCNYFLNRDDALIGSADTVIATPGIVQDVKTDAYMYKAKAYLHKQKYDSASSNFLKVSELTKSEMQAEAKYNMANIQYLQNDYAASEKTIFDLVNQEPSYPEWMAKGLVLLSDDYVAVKDNFQAKHTLNTVIENASDTAVVNMAKHKLDKINEDEQKALPKPVQQNPGDSIPADSANVKQNNK
jgi:tetratricopeptide (TPR) repeat protein